MNDESPSSAGRFNYKSSGTIEQLDAAISQLTLHMNTVEYRLLRLVREFDDRLGWAKWSFPSCAAWLAWRCGIGLSAAREKVRVAHALRDLRVISKAFEKGRVSYSKVRALTRAATEATEEELLEYAFTATAVQVEERCRQIRNVRAESVEEARRAWQRRSLSIYRNAARGTMTISVEVPLDAGEVVARALDKAVQSGDVAAGPEFGGDGWHAQQADALITIARTYLARGRAERAPTATSVEGSSVTAPAGACRRGASMPDHYQVVVHVDEAALRGGAGRSELPVETVKRLACDASVVVVTEDDSGDPLSIGRRRRIVPAALRRALWSRDRGCTFPGCGNTGYMEAHHLRHWAEGGETSLENTALLCSHHHRLVHEGGLRMRRSSGGEIVFHLADGSVIPPCGYRTEDAAPDPIVLDTEYSSAEAWLAALIRKKLHPAGSVREESPVYRIDPQGSSFAYSTAAIASAT
jgi:hypothetical protein